MQVDGAFVVLIVDMVNRAAADFGITMYCGSVDLIAVLAHTSIAASSNS
tara:strand:- start:703 stop:849 length:147 start_codon:yes stop_codon:yes gene_type:complete